MSDKITRNKGSILPKTDINDLIYCCDYIQELHEKNTSHLTSNIST